MKMRHSKKKAIMTVYPLKNLSIIHHQQITRVFRGATIIKRSEIPEGLQ